jgi:Fe-S-cluster-containing hydrogenase component 2
MAVKIDKNRCISCGGCIAVCPVAALEMKERFPLCKKEVCTDCRICIKFCPVRAIELEGKAADRRLVRG